MKLVYVLDKLHQSPGFRIVLPVIRENVFVVPIFIGESPFGRLAQG